MPWPVGLDPDKPVAKFLEDATHLFEAWRHERVTEIPTLPEGLYHYTNATALMNIFRTKQLWATNAVYTNDRTEVAHSLVQLMRIVGEDLKDRRTDPAADTMLMVVEEFYTIVEAFLVCFCTSDDLLSQWRGYGQQGGYAIGFVPTGLLHLLHTGHVLLVPVVYDQAQQDRLIRELVKRWREVFTNLKPEDDTRPNRRLGAFSFAQLFAYLALAFKNQKFGEEQEWRLVFRRQRIFPH